MASGQRLWVEVDTVCIRRGRQNPVRGQHLPDASDGARRRPLRSGLQIEFDTQGRTFFNKYGSQGLSYTGSRNRDGGSRGIRH
jgi:hypothetical protein